jgi:membrane dipeptidase
MGVQMSRLRISILLILGLVLVALALFLHFMPAYIDSSQNVVTDHAPYKLSDKAKTLHKGLVIGDLHSDALLWKRNLSKWGNRGHTDFPRLRAGNVAIQVFPTVTKSPSGQNYIENSSDTDMIALLAKIQLWPYRTWNSLSERALCQAERLHRYEERAPQEVKVIRTKADLEAVLASRKNGSQTLAALLSFEGAHALEGDLANIDRFFDAGFRLMELHHFFDNELGGSLHGQSKKGLSTLGREMVGQMDNKEIIIDVAHSSEKVVEDVLALVSSPIIVSHTGLRGQCDSPRNISDALLKKVADRGGLIGIGFWDGAICDPSPEGIVVAIRYAIDTLGVDHVALGSDWDGTTTVTFDASELSILTETMLAQGFSEEEIRKVMGENLETFLLMNLPGPEGSVEIQVPSSS